MHINKWDHIKQGTSTSDFWEVGRYDAGHFKEPSFNSQSQHLTGLASHPRNSFVKPFAKEKFNNTAFRECLIFF